MLSWRDSRGNRRADKGRQSGSSSTATTRSSPPPPVWDRDGRTHHHPPPPPPPPRRHSSRWAYVDVDDDDGDGDDDVPGEWSAPASSYWPTGSCVLLETWRAGVVTAQSQYSQRVRESQQVFYIVFSLSLILPPHLTLLLGKSDTSQSVSQPGREGGRELLCSTGPDRHSQPACVHWHCGTVGLDSSGVSWCGVYGHSGHSGELQ